MLPFTKCYNLYEKTINNQIVNKNYFWRTTEKQTLMKKHLRFTHALILGMSQEYAP